MSVLMRAAVVAGALRGMFPTALPALSAAVVLWTKDVRQRVEEHVARWRSEHDRWWRPRLPSPQKVIKGIATAKTIVDVVNQTPELRQLADTVTQAVLARLRERRSPKEPPTASS